MNDFLADVRHEFLRHKGLADRAMAQLDDPEFFRRPGALVNPVALIVKHLAGNLVSRWYSRVKHFRQVTAARSSVAIPSISAR